MASERFYLTYSQDQVKEPIIYWVGQKFRVVTNIRGASVSDHIGIVALDAAEGSELWRAPLPKPAYLMDWGAASSPVIHPRRSCASSCWDRSAVSTAMTTRR